MLGYLSHVDTVLASPEDWSRDPWSGELHDGFVWGRGALDMKSQTAAEVVAGAALAREGWRPPRGELKIISVADEEVGGAGRRPVADPGAPRPRALRLCCSTRAPGRVIPYGDRRLYGVCCAEKGTFRFAVRTSGRAGHASVPALADNALLKLLPLRRAARRGGRDARPDRPAARVPVARSGSIPTDPRRRRCAASARIDERLAAMVEPTFGGDVRADDHRGVEQDQRHPRARRAEGRLPRARRDGRRGDDGARPRGARRHRRRRGRVPRGGRSATARRSSRR